jgi:hypothetical protein
MHPYVKVPNTHIKRTPLVPTAPVQVFNGHPSCTRRDHFVGSTDVPIVFHVQTAVVFFEKALGTAFVHSDFAGMFPDPPGLSRIAAN